MDFSSDFVRREANESQIEHAAAMGSIRDLVSRLFDGTRGRSAAAKADLLTGGLNRRRFLTIGGVTVASAAVFAACGSDDATTAEKAVDETEEDEASQSDLRILRTASSLELVAVDVYQKAIDSGLLTTTAVADAANLFQGQHQEHAELFQNATKELGGEPFEKANPVLQGTIAPALAAAKDEPALVRLAFDLENAAAATYFSTAGTFDARKLNQAAMSVGGVEARHAAVLASVLRQPQVTKAFWTADGAVAAGTGV